MDFTKPGIKIDVRILAATNAIMEDVIYGGDFRADLFRRINGYPYIYHRFVIGKQIRQLLWPMLKYCRNRNWTME